MGVLNVTPDSFSDGGCFADRESAVAHGLAMAAAGADYVDVGGESTRPGAGRVDAAEERRRVVPVVRDLTAAGVRVSVDTTRTEVATAAIAAGAVLVNDISGGLADDGMAALVADAGVPWVLMHWRGHSREMYARAEYGDVVTEVCAELSARVDAALSAGVDAAQLVLDPGLGFAKQAAHNWALLAALPRVVALGQPVLVGASRKSFLGRLLSGPDGALRHAAGRDAATLATTVLAAEAGAWGVRVHDAAGSADAVRTVAAVQRAREDARRD
jgi:dihydropteroate synthase